ncbi:hypothetical protein K3G39_06975 [Pontibacter sp. HSC-14F20]|uniref:hypothetical protein n=1 Tax=Pontibacter sp. HSC-14F20 TaxID=2864136 RepID=UPI001C72AA5E|nr:hypothetical protein [Pontibacter sp. HSC-14F20]MBX0332976.1 hypothetical protein [Pontibacter sp. HSC-14F20]
MIEKENLLSQIRLLLHHAGTPLSAYDIAYRLLSQRLQQADSVEQLRQRVLSVVIYSPLELLFHQGKVKLAIWTNAQKPTVQALHRVFCQLLSSDLPGLSDWHQPAMLSLLLYRFTSEHYPEILDGQLKYSFIIQHFTPPAWPEQLGEVMRTMSLPDSRMQRMSAFGAQFLPQVNPTTLYQMVQQVSAADMSGIEPLAFPSVFRKLFT